MFEYSYKLPLGEHMKLNIHPIERAFRIILGVGLIAFALVGVESSWGYIGFVPLLTGLKGWCPAYTIMGYSSCPVHVKKHK
jgi:hypothetical protein